MGTGNTEVYLLDGATSLGVFTVDGTGAVVSSFFNVLAGDKVIGRQPSIGNRRYYHTDLLGSTRAVVEGASVVESYDYEPWGLLMPGRTLAGPTKEGFTSKERDAETGLDYFGARYYMPALARWTAVDPQAARFGEWSPYNYGLNNPTATVDPDGEAPWVVWGFFIGAGVELGGQVLGGLISGKSLGESLDAVDLSDVLFAGVAGAATGGLSSIRTAGTGVKLAGAALTSVGEGAVKANTGTERTEYGLGDAVFDATLGVTGQTIADNVADGLKTSRQGRTLAREAERAERVREGSPNPRASRVRQAEQARARAEGYGSGALAQTVQAAATGSVAGIRADALPRPPEGPRRPPVMRSREPDPPVIRARP